MNAYDVAGFITGLINVWLVVRNHVWNWPWGIVNAAVFLVSFWTAGLYGDSALQVVYIIMNAYGWWAWLHGGRGAQSLPVSRIRPSALIASLVATALLTGIFATILAGALGSTVPLWDGLTTALSLVAQALLTRRILENWYFWIVADCIYVPLYAYKGLPLTSILYVIFLGLCIAGVIRWQRALVGDHDNGSTP